MEKTIAPSRKRKAQELNDDSEQVVTKKRVTKKSINSETKTVEKIKKSAEKKEPKGTKRDKLEYSNDEQDATDVKVPKIAVKKKQPLKKTEKPVFDNKIDELQDVTDAKVPKKAVRKKQPLKKTEKLECGNEIDDLQDVPDEVLSVWNEIDMLSHSEHIPHNVAQKFIGLLTEGCTLPFIARYRKEAVDFLPPDRLQELYESYQNVIQFKKKVQSVIQTLKKNNKWTQEVENSILNAKSMSELDLIYAPLKSQTKSLAEKARDLGLEPFAIKALNGEYIKMEMLCDVTNEELATLDKVESHITHIVADIMYKDARVIQHMRDLKSETRFTFQSSQTKSSTKEKKVDEKKKLETRSDPETYKIYFDWKCPVHFVKSHQTLAVNRGEDEKILSVKVNVPDWFYNKLERFCLTLWRSGYWVRKGLNDAYNRLIKPWIARQVRSDLNVAAHKEAIKTFTTNLEKYLLTEPVKNRRILGIDPGFKAGCKVGIIDRNGEKLEALTMYPDLRRCNQHDAAARQMKVLLNKHSVELIGLGNGTACRETEQWLRNHQISDQVPVIIVPEQGASVYSISKEAQKEHPNMDPNLISALSIARRVLDPLGELIKVEPKNLGVGLYQHDIPPKMLESALDSAVEKVVSLVGVDINTASQAMLRRISGLNEGRAKKIIAYRVENEKFTSRAEILKVPGVGKITYQQCAGFLKVLGGVEPLDTTIIHPESYKIAKLFAKKIGVNLKDLTNPNFPAQVERSTQSINLGEMSKELDTEVSTLDLIVSAFKQKPYEDNVITFCRPVYSMVVQGSEQIQIGTNLTGVVRNVVPFGCFVDCGVGDNGLIHRSQLGGNLTPKLGDRVAVTVIASPKPKKLKLKLDRILD